MSIRKGPEEQAVKEVIDMLELIYPETARITWDYFQALQEQGFSEEQAMALLTSKGLPTDQV